MLHGNEGSSNRRGLVPTPLGHLHYIAFGPLDSNLTPILAFHMSPRSVDEYAQAAPLLSSTNRGRLVVAIDEFGYGASDSPARSCTLEEIADCMLLVADCLDLTRFVAVGSLMGNFFALSLASRYPDRVRAAICTNLYHFPDAKRDEARRKQEERGTKEEEASAAGEAVPPISDSFKIEEDGSHISALWGQRSSFLDPVLNTRVVSDQLTYLLKRRERYLRGAYIQDGAAFDLEGSARDIACPVLCIQGAGATAFFDAIGLDMTGQFEKALKFFGKNAEVAVINGPGSINLINQNAAEWAETAAAFLEHRGVDEE